MADVTAKLAEALRLISFASMDRGARDTATEALREYDAAKAQPVQDERAAFEAWMQKRHPGAVGAELIGKEENSPDTYVFFGVNKQWAAWQARAALAATPAPTERPVPDRRTALESTQEGRAVIAQAQADIATPAPEPDADAQDAERYRWLRENSATYASPKVPIQLIAQESWASQFDGYRKHLDAAIDAARAGQGKKASK